MNKYDYNLSLKKNPVGAYEIISDRGHVMHTLTKCSSDQDAMDQATAWASSWRSVCIKMEYDKDNS